VAENGGGGAVVDGSVVHRDAEGHVIYDDELHTERGKARDGGSLAQQLHQQQQLQLQQQQQLQQQDANDQASVAWSHAYSDGTTSIRGLTASLSDGFGRPIPLSDENDDDGEDVGGYGRTVSSRLSSSRPTVAPPPAALTEEEIKQGTSPITVALLLIISRSCSR
jgi:hypothetical protein